MSTRFESATVDLPIICLPAVSFNEDLVNLAAADLPTVDLSARNCSNIGLVDCSTLNIPNLGLAVLFCFVLY